MCCKMYLSLFHEMIGFMMFYVCNYCTLGCHGMGCLTEKANGMLNISMYIVGPIGVHQPYLPNSISSKDMFEISMDRWI